MSARKPVHDLFDAVVDFFPPDGAPAFAYGLFKQTWLLVGDRVLLGGVEPLFHDVRDKQLTPLWLPGSDFWPHKRATDVAVRGSAYAPRGRPVTSQRLRLAVGERTKHIMVFGDRKVTWTGRGNLRFEHPVPYTEMPVVWAHAYGGWDPRVPVTEPPTVALAARLEFDHPGMYPRNPYGRGYTVVNQPAAGIVLPNLEDPNQLLAPETFVTGDPARWYRQPLPACFDYTTAMMFHRLCWLGAEAWHHPPANARLAEVALGHLPTDWHKLRGGLQDAPDALQDGSYGQVFADLLPGTPIVVDGMHPERPSLRFAVPAAPKLEFHFEGEVYPGVPQLTNVLIEPEFPRMSLTYVARLFESPRVFIPGIHGRIPLAMTIDGASIGEHVIAYDTPPTLRDQRRRAGA